MATCPKCRHFFRVLADEDPRDFGCPRCGYGEPETRAEDDSSSDEDDSDEDEAE